MGVFETYLCIKSLQEVSKKDEAENVLKLISNLYQHLMKYEYLRSKQTKLWILSILNSFKNIQKIMSNGTVRNLITKNKIDNAITKGIYAAIYEKSNIKNKHIPIRIPDKFQWELLNMDYLYNYLVKAAYTDEAKIALKQVKRMDKI